MNKNNIRIVLMVIFFFLALVNAAIGIVTAFTPPEEIANIHLAGWLMMIDAIFMLIFFFATSRK